MSYITSQVVIIFYKSRLLFISSDKLFLHTMTVLHTIIHFCTCLSFIIFYSLKQIGRVYGTDFRILPNTSAVIICLTCMHRLGQPQLILFVSCLISLRFDPLTLHCMVQIPGVSCTCTAAFFIFPQNKTHLNSSVPSCLSW